ncbi:hypothetical protein BDN72DRAFT_865448 [Pluteus cervinus]|uniref:Uncharacterized protein n=1 Tax=Pluteus cervinus TaxID=181527 RepID=A0ACD2ZZT9_9AGAR|nr:hypothetical protein BDN72DRAFT_865448 [Pluteus cervinus]
MNGVEQDASPGPPSSLGRSSRSPSSQDDDPDNSYSPLRQEGGSQSPPSTPTPARQSTASKRPAEDTLQFSQNIGKRLKLAAASQVLLDDLSQMPPGQQVVGIAGLALSIKEGIEKLTPLGASFEIPEDMERRVEKAVYLELVSAALASYIGDSIVGSVTDKLMNASGSGVTHEFMDDVSKAQALDEKVRSLLTSIRNSLKTALIASIEEKIDIIQACHKLLSVRPGLKCARPKPTIQLCARVAFLRNFYMDEKDRVGRPPGRDFWKSVDKKLQETRTMYKEDKEKISSFFAVTLENDQATFGKAAMDELATAKKT